MKVKILSIVYVLASIFSCKTESLNNSKETAVKQLEKNFVKSAVKDIPKTIIVLKDTRELQLAGFSNEQSPTTEDLLISAGVIAGVSAVVGGVAMRRHALKSAKKSAQNAEWVESFIPPEQLNPLVLSKNDPEMYSYTGDKIVDRKIRKQWGDALAQTRREIGEIVVPPRWFESSARREYRIQQGEELLPRTIKREDLTVFSYDSFSAFSNKVIENPENKQILLLMPRNRVESLKGTLAKKQRKYSFEQVYFLDNASNVAIKKNETYGVYRLEFKDTNPPLF